MEELCAEVIFGTDFIILHSKIEYKMHGPQEASSVDGPLKKACKVMRSNHKKFFNLQYFRNCVSVATKCRQQGKSDKKFIKEESISFIKILFLTKNTFLSSFYKICKLR